jgi:hypothetical protein
VVTLSRHQLSARRKILVAMLLYFAISTLLTECHSVIDDLAVIPT